jgi:ubiquinone biosynthesis protein COQ9
LKALAKTADAIWRAAGDRSTDFNWYTKRALVSAVYVATVAYWLNDKSDGFQDTWTFLDRRIDTVLKVPMQAKSMLGKFSTYMPRPTRIAAELRRRRTAGSW